MYMYMCIYIYIYIYIYIERERSIQNLCAGSEVENRFWAEVGRSWAEVGRSWVPVGRSWVQVGRSCAKFGPSWTLWGPSWPRWGEIWSKLVALGSILAPDKGPFWCLCATSSFQWLDSLAEEPNLISTRYGRVEMRFTASARK